MKHILIMMLCANISYSAAKINPNLIKKIIAKINGPKLDATATVVAAVTWFAIGASQIKKDVKANQADFPKKRIS